MFQKHVKKIDVALTAEAGSLELEDHIRNQVEISVNIRLNNITINVSCQPAEVKWNGGERYSITSKREV